MAAIAIERVTKRFGDTVAVRALSLHVEDHEFVTLLGPSGCGKTTLLRLIAGFMAPDEGAIRVGAATLSTPAGVVPPERRGMGMVFQNYAVWPHKNVYDNVAFGLYVRHVARAEIRTQVARVLGLVNLAPARVRRAGSTGLVALGGEHLVEVALPPGMAEGAAVQMAVRPENLRVTALAPGAALRPGVVPGTIADLTFLGNLVDCHVTLDDGTRVRVQVDPGQRLQIGLPA